MSSGWLQLTDKQQEAAKAAARLIEDEGLQFLLLLFGDDSKRGAIIGNIEPADAVRLIEAAYAAAKAMVAGEGMVEEIDKGRLQ